MAWAYRRNKEFVFDFGFQFVVLYSSTPDNGELSWGTEVVALPECLSQIDAAL